MTRSIITVRAFLLDQNQDIQLIQLGVSTVSTITQQHPIESK